MIIKVPITLINKKTRNTVEVIAVIDTVKRETVHRPLEDAPVKANDTDG